MHLNLKRRIRCDEVLEPLADARIGHGNGLARLGLEPKLQGVGEVAADISEVLFDLKPDPHLAVGTDEAGVGAWEQRADPHDSVGAGDLQQSGGGRDNFAQCDPIAFAGKSLKRTGDERHSFLDGLDPTT